MKACDGYLKEIPYKEAFKKSFENCSEEDIKKTWNMPNFDAQLFFEISGIDYFLNNKNE